MYVERYGIVGDLEQAIREKLAELENEHTGKRKEHEPINVETSQEQNDGKRQKLEMEHATTQQTEPGAMESDKTETEASSVPSPNASATVTASVSDSASPSSALTPSPLSPSGHFVLGVLRSFVTGMHIFSSTESIEWASGECDGYYLHHHQRYPVQAMEMTIEEYEWCREYEAKKQTGRQFSLFSQLLWFYPCIHPCGDGIETGFRLVITYDMTIADVRKKVAQRLRDQKPERWKIVILGNKSYMQQTWRDGRTKTHISHHNITSYDMI